MLYSTWMIDNAATTMLFAVRSGCVGCGPFRVSGFGGNWAGMNGTRNGSRYHIIMYYGQLAS